MTTAELTQAMIPTPVRENHASFLHLLPDGTMGCAWFGGSKEGKPDVSIYFSRLTDTWSEPVKVSRDDTRSEQNPVLATRDDGSLWLLYTSQEFGSQDTAVVMGQTSSDLGATWSEPSVVMGTPGTFLRSPFARVDGRWVAPIFHCVSLPGRQWHGDADVSAVAVSSDGVTWEEVAVPSSTGLVHMALVQLADGSWAAFYRSRWADRVYRSVSSDGVSYSEPVPTDVPNGNSSIQVCAVPGTDLLLMVCNPVSAPEGSSLGDQTEDRDNGKQLAPGERKPLERHAVWGQPRVPLTLFSSSDGGVTWSEEMVLEDRDSSEEALDQRGGRREEMSYPAVAVDADGEVHVTWSYHRMGIKWARIRSGATHL